MGEETCGGCRSWEEDIYWSHFQCIHFSRFLRAGFDRCLAIPEKFSKNLKKKLPDIVTLKGPSGLAWKVGLTTNDDILSFNNGWQEFVNDHGLEEEDFLIFRYNGDSQFDVLVFDKQSMCEKETSYFVRKCRRTDDKGCQTPRKNVPNSAEVLTPSPEVGGGSQPEKSSNSNIDTVPLGLPIISADKKRTRKEIKKVRTKQSVRNTELAACAEDIDHETDLEYLGERAVSSMQYVSTRRPVTEEERSETLQLAQAAVTNKGFLVVMKPSSVYRRFFMSIPSSWMANHLISLDNQDMILRCKENTWSTRFYYQKARRSGGLSSGWKGFAVDNNLQEFDVCVFEPESLENNPIVLDVNIFRVVPEVSPLVPASASTGS